jgi:ribosomal protein RSM22 (predicted rRNA methylase)
MSHGVSKTAAEVKDLHRLRQLFLEAPTQDSVSDYWSDVSLLGLYDETYGRRIGWKWNAVFRELQQRQWVVPSSINRIIDWGCGSGIASESLFSQFLTQDTSSYEVVLSDRSQKARSFAAEKIKKIHNSAKVSCSTPELLAVSQRDLIVVSHVLTELNDNDLSRLTSQVKNAGAVLWVEPGTPFCAQKIANLRQELIRNFRIIAPCPHSLSCPLQTQEGDWCHFFASPPAEIFQSSFWRHFAKEMRIDLRSLPVSFFVLERRPQLDCATFHESAESGEKDPAGNSQQPVSSTPGSFRQRIIARPRFYKGHAKVLSCNSDGSSSRHDLQQRHFKKEFKEWEKDSFYAQFSTVQDCD